MHHSLTQPSVCSLPSLALRAVGILLATSVGLLAFVPARAEGPGGRSRILHVECGAFCPGGSKPWAARWDEATLAKGYGYSVDGETYMGGSPELHCWFFTERGSVTVKCPSRITGSLHLFFLDVGNSNRRQAVIVEGKHRSEIENFGYPRGAWRKYELTSDDTADGKIVVELAKVAGANAVISRIDFVPDGLKDVLIAEQDVVETIPKCEHSSPQRLDMGVGSGWDPRRILGTIPVEKDGSAHFEVPAGKSIFLQALDERHMNIRGMRSFMNLQANEKVSCVGCHESYGTAPPNQPALALVRKPSKIEPPPWGAVPVSFPKLVQPVLERRCVKSQLLKLLDAGHHDVKLTADERRAIVAWIDCNAPYLGGWDEYFVGKR